MHLSYKPSKYKGKVYKSYSIAESYREGKSVKKNELWKLGKLTDLQALQIKYICKVITDPEVAITTIQDIVVQECKYYGPIAIANALWDKWQLSRAFKYNNTESDLPTDLIAKILTINRCTAPCSHYSLSQWISKNAISEIVDKDLSKINESKLYYELDKIDQNHENLEEHLFRKMFSKDPTSFQYINYDLSSSYFVGFKCDLAYRGKSKDDKPKNKQVVLGILVNDRGYPFKWDVYPGNMAEVHTLSNNIEACVKRFKLKNINLVFDRGIVSNKNLKQINDVKLKYISALDKDQIPKINSLDVSIFSEITSKNHTTHLKKHGFQIFDSLLFYKDLGVIDDRRYVLGFNPELFRMERKCREEKIEYFEKFLVEKNKELENAQRSRKELSTQQIILTELKRLKIKKYFDPPELTPLKLERQNKKGEVRFVNSFKVMIARKKKVLMEWKKLDGLCVFISNHVEIEKDKFIFSAEKIIMAYREKTKIEDAFKHIKSFLNIRPFCVNTPAHVRAVYDLCVLAYFLNKDLAERRKKVDKKDYLNSKNLYEPFKKYFYYTLRDKVTSKTKSQAMEIPQNMKNYLKSLGIEI